MVTSAALTIGESEIGRICEEVLLKPSCGSIKRIPVQYTFDDLKLWPEQKGSSTISVRTYGTGIKCMMNGIWKADIPMEKMYPHCFMARPEPVKPWQFT